MMPRTAIHPLKILAAVGAAFLLWGLLLAYASSPAWAADITVGTTADEQNTNTQCSLREAIINANGDNQSGSSDCVAGSGDDVINFALPGTAPWTVALNGVLPVLSSNIDIQGPGADRFTVRRDTGVGGNYVIFDVAGGSVVSVSGMTISDGNASDGGGISNREGGTLTVADSTITDNVAQAGGGINNRGTLTVTGSTISGNSASSTGTGGGGVFTDTFTTTGVATTTTITNSTISGNTTEGFGGGVYNEDGRTVIEHSTVTDNTAPSGQGSGVASFGDLFTPTEVLSTIVSENTNTDVDFVRGTSPTNSFVSRGHNLVGDGNATGAFNQTGDQTRAPTPGSTPWAPTAVPPRPTASSQRARP